MSESYLVNSMKILGTQLKFGEAAKIICVNYVKGSVKIFNFILCELKEIDMFVHHHSLFG